MQYLQHCRRCALLSLVVHGSTAAAATAAASSAPPCVAGGKAWGLGLKLTPGSKEAAGNVTLQLTPDNDLQVVRSVGGAVLWSLGTHDPGCAVTPAPAACEASLQGDGNFVVHGSRGQSLFHSETYNRNVTSIELARFSDRDEAYLAIFDSSCHVVWWSNANTPPPGKVDSVKYPVQQGLKLRKGDHIDINGVSLMLDYDGNLEVCQTAEAPQHRAQSIHPALPTPGSRDAHRTDELDGFTPRIGTGGIDCPTAPSTDCYHETSDVVLGKAPWSTANDCCAECAKHSGCSIWAGPYNVTSPNRPLCVLMSAQAKFRPLPEPSCVSGNAAPPPNPPPPPPTTEPPRAPTHKPGKTKNKKIQATK